MTYEELDKVRAIARDIAKQEIALALKTKKTAPEPEPVKADHKKGGK